MKHSPTVRSLFASASETYLVGLDGQEQIYLYFFQKDKHKQVIDLVLFLLDITSVYLNECNKKFIIKALMKILFGSYLVYFIIIFV